MTFSSLPDRRAAADPDGPAVADATQSLTNSEFLGHIRSVAAQLTEAGIVADDVIALRLTNRVEFVVLLFAAWRVGAAVTPVNPALTPPEVARQLDDSATKLLVIENNSAGVAGVASIEISDLRYNLTAKEDLPDEDPAALALLVYTSGTTGTPKGVMLDHANLDAMTEMGREALQLDSTDKCLLILPLFHVNVEKEQPTFFSAVPTIYSMLASLPDEVQPDTSSVRFAVCGAAPASADLLTRFEDRFGFPLVEGYGLSEATCGSTINPVAGQRKPGTVGLPVPGQEIQILDPRGDPLPQGANGDIVVRGANVMRGYLGRPDDTAATVVDGWLRTGDVGHLDEDGYLVLVGRSKEMIIRGGENIYPKEIEDVLASDPTILDAAVIGIPDATWGEIVVAYVEPRPGATVDLGALKTLCQQNLSGYKRPKDIHILKTLPKNAVGKLDKNALRTIPTGNRKPL